MSLVLPLPQALQRLLGDGRVGPRNGDNLGLWLDKFVRVDSRKWKLEATPRVAELERLFCAHSWHSAPAADAIARMRHSCELLYGSAHRSVAVRVHGRLLVDYGRASAIETSLSLHPVLGCPRIPGSALKGLLRAGLREQLETDPERLHGLLGAPDAATEEEADHRRGRLVLHDALPEGGKFRLALDVLTPHARDYYEGKRTALGDMAPPADWISPIPHTFLTVVETSFRLMFGLLPRVDGDGASDSDQLDLVESVLLEALDVDGIGAKTAAGYGRLTRVHD